MKRVLAVVSSILLTSSFAYAADVAMPQNGNIAVLNVQQIFQQSSKIDTLNKKMQDQFKSRQEKLVAAQKSLQSEREQLDSKTLSAKDKDALQKKVSSDEANLTKEATAFQQDLRSEQNKVMKNVLAQLNDVVSGIAKKNNYTLVLDSQAVIYGGDKNDITKQVADAFNK
jgi:outer membrane protein